MDKWSERIIRAWGGCGPPPEPKDSEVGMCWMFSSCSSRSLLYPAPGPSRLTFTDQINGLPCPLAFSWTQPIASTNRRLEHGRRKALTPSTLPPWSTRVGLCLLLFKLSSLLWVRLLFLVRTWTDRGRTSSLNSKSAAEAGSSGDSQESGWVERIYGGVLTIIQPQEYLLLFAIYCALSTYQVLWWVFCIHCHI